MTIKAPRPEEADAAPRPVVPRTDRPGATDPEDDRTMGRAAAWLAKQVEIGLGQADLSAPQYRVLGLLDESPAVSSDLAERLAVRPPSVTAIIDGLVARGLVERRNVAADRRRVHHVLTADGRRALDSADAAVAGRLGDIAACLADHAEAERAFEGLRAWRKAFGAYRMATRAVR